MVTTYNQEGWCSRNSEIRRESEIWPNVSGLLKYLQYINYYQVDFFKKKSTLFSKDVYFLILENNVIFNFCPDLCSNSKRECQKVYIQVKITLATDNKL